MRGDLGAERARDLLGLVVKLGVGPALLAHEAAHVLERVGGVAGRVVGVDSEDAHAARAYASATARSCGFQATTYGQCMQVTTSTVAGGRVVERRGMLRAVGVGEREGRDRVAEPEAVMHRGYCARP